jgi:hypothetical protein
LVSKNFLLGCAFFFLVKIALILTERENTIEN